MEILLFSQPLIPSFYTLGCPQRYLSGHTTFPGSMCYNVPFRVRGYFSGSVSLKNGHIWLSRKIISHDVFMFFMSQGLTYFIRLRILLLLIIVTVPLSFLYFLLFTNARDTMPHPHLPISNYLSFGRRYKCFTMKSNEISYHILQHYLMFYIFISSTRLYTIQI